MENGLQTPRRKKSIEIAIVDNSSIGGRLLTEHQSAYVAGSFFNGANAFATGFRKKPRIPKYSKLFV